MRRNVKIALLVSCAWMFAFVYYYHTSRDTKVRHYSLQLVLHFMRLWEKLVVMIHQSIVVDVISAVHEIIRTLFRLCIILGSVECYLHSIDISIIFHIIKLLTQHTNYNKHEKLIGLTHIKMRIFNNKINLHFEILLLQISFFN